MANYAKVIVELTRQMINDWPQVSEIDVLFQMNNLTLRMIFQAMFQVELTG